MSLRVGENQLKNGRAGRSTFDPAAKSGAVDSRNIARLQGADRRFEDSDLAERYIDDLIRNSTDPISVTRFEPADPYATDKAVRWVFVEPVINGQFSQAVVRNERRAQSLLPGVRTISSVNINNNINN